MKREIARGEKGNSGGKESWERRSKREIAEGRRARRVIVEGWRAGGGGEIAEGRRAGRGGGVKREIAEGRRAGRGGGVKREIAEGRRAGRGGGVKREIAEGRRAGRGGGVKREIVEGRRAGRGERGSMVRRGKERGRSVVCLLYWCFIYYIHPIMQTPLYPGPLKCGHFSPTTVQIRGHLPKGSRIGLKGVHCSNFSNFTHFHDMLRGRHCKEAILSI